MPWSRPHCFEWLFAASCYLVQKLILVKGLEGLDGSLSITNEDLDGDQLSTIESSVVAVGTSVLRALVIIGETYLALDAVDFPRSLFTNQLEYFPIHFLMAWSLLLVQSELPVAFKMQIELTTLTIPRKSLYNRKKIK